MPRLSRRHFLAAASLTAANLAVARGARAQMGGRMGGGGMGGTTTIVDPPQGDWLRDPTVAPNLSTTPGVVEVSIDARPAMVAVDGRAATLLTYSGSYIAPTIRARKHDLVKLHFANSLPPASQPNLLGHYTDLTNIHVHGWHVSPSGMADDVMIKVLPGDRREYEYPLDRVRPGALGLYHPHVHGSVAEQMWGGLVGALEVADEVTALAGYETHLLVLKDLTLSSGQPAPYSSRMEYMHGKEGDLVMVDAQVNPKLAARPGQVQRWRILNASTARFYRLSLQGHTLNLVGSDGGLLDKPYPQSAILVAPGERLDLLIKASSKPGDYKLLALPYARNGGMTSAQTTLMTLKVSGGTANDAIPQVIDPAAKRVAMSTSGLRRVSFTLSMSHGLGYINGKTWGSDPCMLMSSLGTWEVWEIVNQSGMDHPWHQHVNDAQVLSISGGDSAYAKLYTTAPAWKDTVIVPKWGRVTMLVPVMDYPGMTMFHCHIAEHEDIGMMGMWHIMDDMGGGGMGGMGAP